MSKCRPKLFCLDQWIRYASHSGPVFLTLFGFDKWGWHPNLMSFLPTEYDEPIKDNQMTQFYLQLHLRATSLPATATVFTEMPAWLVFLKLEFSRHIFSVSWKSIQWVPCCCTRTDVTTLIVPFCNFANSPKNTNVIATNSGYDNEINWGLHGFSKSSQLYVEPNSEDGQSNPVWYRILNLRCSACTLAAVPTIRKKACLHDLIHFMTRYHAMLIMWCCVFAAAGNMQGLEARGPCQCPGVQRSWLGHSRQIAL